MKEKMPSFKSSRGDTPSKHNWNIGEPIPTERGLMASPISEPSSESEESDSFEESRKYYETRLKDLESGRMSGRTVRFDIAAEPVMLTTNIGTQEEEDEGQSTVTRKISKYGSVAIRHGAEEPKNVDHLATPRKKGLTYSRAQEGTDVSVMLESVKHITSTIPRKK